MVELAAADPLSLVALPIFPVLILSFLAGGARLVHPYQMEATTRRQRRPPAVGGELLPPPKGLIDPSDMCKSSSGVFLDQSDVPAYWLCSVSGTTLLHPHLPVLFLPWCTEKMNHRALPCLLHPKDRS